MGLWTDAATERLRVLWEQHKGYSAADIAGILATETLGQFSRNAVIGRARRLGLCNKRNTYTPDDVLRYPPKSSAPVGSTAYKVISAIKRQRKPQPPKSGFYICQDVPPLESRNVSLMDLGRDDCRWPMTESMPHAFCGLRQMEGRSYCPTHFRLSVGSGTPSEQAAHKLPKMVA